MAEFNSILNDPQALADALQSIRIQLSPKQREDLRLLFAAANGVPVTRDDGSRVRGETIHSCSLIGGLLKKHLGLNEPIDQMMWVGHLDRGREGHEFWVMRPQIRAALDALGWYASNSEEQAFRTDPTSMKPVMTAPPSFDTSHTDAFLDLGAMSPGLHWSAFDVDMGEAESGSASLLVTTIWNFLESPDETGAMRVVPAILRDRDSGSLWYELAASPSSSDAPTMKAHRRRVEIALAHGLPIVGFLKDLGSGRASSNTLFDCTRLARGKMDSGAVWVEVMPRIAQNFEIADFRLADVAVMERRLPIQEPYHVFEAAVEEARQDTSEARRARLADAPRRPQRIEVMTTSFLRNPDVVAEVLEAAEGKCGHCGEPAPFLRNGTGTPYLEVHHKVPLAQGGDDTVDNAIAVCPNCHRWFHYGQASAARLA